jgi:hypothetical protein
VGVEPFHVLHLKGLPLESTASPDTNLNFRTPIAHELAHAGVFWRSMGDGFSGSGDRRSCVYPVGMVNWSEVSRAIAAQHRKVVEKALATFGPDVVAIPPR